ncbi:unnamed protein product [Caenorhabditis sp. 36 PRJEB53466]|nr:unnamed protein product [Caenorhabditis sp. 36 PRJEB53466]
MKLGSSRMECDVDKLTKLMESVKCTELLVDWRFHVPENFFEQLHMGKLNSLTVGGQESRHFYRSLSGDQFRKFRGNFLELGANQLTAQDFAIFLQSWKSRSGSEALPFISQYNIVINCPLPELLSLLKNTTIQKAPTEWIVKRNSDSECDEVGEQEELEITLHKTTNFSKRPSIVIRQLRNLADFYF